MKKKLNNTKLNVTVEAKSHIYKIFSYVNNKYCNSYGSLSIAEY